MRNIYNEIQIDSYAINSTLIGKICGTGQLAKMVNQICIAGLLQGLSQKR